MPLDIEIEDRLTLDNKYIFKLYLIDVAMSEILSNYSNKLQCVWYSENTGICRDTYQSLSLLNHHITEHITVYLNEADISSPHNELFTAATNMDNQMRHVIPDKTLYKCLWYGCNHQDEDIELLKMHLYYHAYHLSIQQVGSAHIREKDLPPCTLSNNTRKDNSIIPKFKQLYCCQWLCSKELCGERFSVPADFYNHVWEHVNVLDFYSVGEIYSCKWGDCLYQIRKKSSLFSHLKTHTCEKVVSCPSCGTLFSAVPRFEDHLLRQSKPSSLYECDVCHKYFSTERLLKAHLNKHINSKRCPYCSFTLLDESHLNRHILFKHLDIRTEECKQCGKKFKTKDVLITHAKSCFIPISNLPKVIPTNELHSHEGMPSTHANTNCDSDHVQSSSQSIDRITCTPPSSPHSSSQITNNNTKKNKTNKNSLLKFYACHVCEMKFTRAKYLSLHLMKSHRITKSQFGGIKRFLYKQYEDGYFRLANHLFNVNKTTSCYKCHVCHSKFSTGNKLTNHLIEKHNFKLPNGYSRFRYSKNSDGIYELVMFRIESKTLHKAKT